jgi:membrane dipeptidase
MQDIWSFRTEVSAEAAALHRLAVVVDSHNDLMELVDLHEGRGQADYFASAMLPQLRAGGVDVQVLPIWTAPEYLPEGGLRRILRLVERANRLAARHPDDIRVALTGADVDQAVAEGRIAIVLALEGVEAIGRDVELLQTMARLGVRVVSLTHFERTQLGDGSREEAAGGRLTEAGVAALAVLEELGVVVDVSHLSAAGTEHVLALARRPVIASHSSCRALLDHHRNLSDDHLSRVAAAGGVVGVNFYPWFVDEENPTLDRVVDHIVHAVEVAGIDHVGIGPDFMKEIDDTFYPGQKVLFEGKDAKATIPGMEGPADLPRLTEALLHRNLSEEEITKVLGANYLRVFREVMGRPLVTSGQP